MKLIQDMLRHNKLRLRAPEPEDLQLLYNWENDSDLWQYGSTIAPFSKYILKEYIATYNNNIYEACQLRFLIEDTEITKVVGIIDIFDFDAFNSRAAVGVLIDKSYHNRGYASSALKILKEYCFNFLALTMLYAHIPSENDASLKLFANHGFNCSGDLKSWHRVGKNFLDVKIYQCFR